MASSEKFLPLATDEDPETGVPTYHPSGPGSVSYSHSVVNGSVNNGNSSSGSSATGLMVSGDNGDSNSRSHQFCNCCCDCRRACLIINGIAIGFKVVAMIIIPIVGKFVSNNIEQIEADMDDDKARKDFDEVVREGGITLLEAVFEIYTIIGIALCACGIYGALKFKKWGIITAGSTYAIGLLFGIIGFDFTTMLMSGLFLYPHIIMYKEMREGTMTELNYHKVARCCGDRQM